MNGYDCDSTTAEFNKNRINRESEKVKKLEKEICQLKKRVSKLEEL